MPCSVSHLYISRGEFVFEIPDCLPELFFLLIKRVFVEFFLLCVFPVYECFFFDMFGEGFDRFVDIAFFLDFVSVLDQIPCILGYIVF